MSKNENAVRRYGLNLNVQKEFLTNFDMQNNFGHRNMPLTIYRFINTEKTKEDESQQVSQGGEEEGAKAENPSGPEEDTPGQKEDTPEVI